MGVQIGKIVAGREVEISYLSGRLIAIDAYNFIHQFLATIRDKVTGEPLKDRKGRITSHLSGTFYRTVNLMENGIKTVWVFDGRPPEFKAVEISERNANKIEAMKKWEEALKKGEEAKKYAQATSRVTDEIVEEVKELLGLFGIPSVQAISEGEIQAAYMCKRGDVWAVASQDYDALLVGAPRLVRNLSISQRRKLPNKEVYTTVNPELVELEKVLEELGINQEQLILIGLLVGTDYNPGIKGIGPKKALDLVKECKDLDSLLDKVEFESKEDIRKIFNFFIDPPVVDDYKLEWKKPRIDKIVDFLVANHDFSEDRVRKALNKIEESLSKGVQSSLEGWMKK